MTRGCFSATVRQGQEDGRFRRKDKSYLFSPDYVDDVAQAAVEGSRDHVLSLAKGIMKQNDEEFVRWWVEDKDGNVLESQDDFRPPARPTMWS